MESTNLNPENLSGNMYPVNLGLNYYLNPLPKNQLHIPYNSSESIPELIYYMNVIKNELPFINSVDDLSYQKKPKIKHIYLNPNSSLSPLYEFLLPIINEANLSLYNFDITHITDLKLVQISKGPGFIDWHQDIGDNYLSTRKLTFIIPLSTQGEDYEGGNFEFLDRYNKPQSLQVTPETPTLFPSLLMNKINKVTKGKLEFIMGFACGSALK